MPKFSDDSEDESNCDMQSDLDPNEVVNKIEVGLRFLYHLVVFKCKACLDLPLKLGQ